jgi:hypothetical protein
VPSWKSCPVLTTRILKGIICVWHSTEFGVFFIRTSLVLRLQERKLASRAMLSFGNRSWRRNGCGGACGRVQRAEGYSSAIKTEKKIQMLSAHPGYLPPKAISRTWYAGRTEGGRSASIDACKRAQVPLRKRNSSRVRIAGSARTYSPEHAERHSGRARNERKGSCVREKRETGDWWMRAAGQFRARQLPSAPSPTTPLGSASAAHLYSLRCNL